MIISIANRSKISIQNKKLDFVFNNLLLLLKSKLKRVLKIFA